MKPKITVVMPVYKAEKFLRGSLDSILNQTITGINVICVNDASPDASKQILEEYAQKDDRVIVINHDVNKGAGASRNDGLDYIFSNNLETEYIAFVDADDKLDPNAYKKSYEEAKKSNADILNFNFLPSTYWQYKTEATGDIIEYNGDCLNAIFDHNEFYTFIVCWSKLYKKDLLKDIRFTSREFFEDGSFAYKVLPRANKLRVIPDTFYEYNIENPYSTCGKIDELKRLKAIFHTMKETLNDWKELGIVEEYKYKYIQHIILYASLVCPNVIEGNYTSELNDSLGLNVVAEETLNNVTEDTKVLIRKMTTDIKN